MILLQLFLSFAQVGAFCVGGAYAAMPLIRNQVVSVNGWMTMSEFADLVTIAEMTPGPIIVNAATFCGIRVAGLAGAAAATLGAVAPSIVLVSLLAVAYRKYHNLAIVSGILGSLRPAVVALIASAGLGILGVVVFPEGYAGAGGVSVQGVVLFGAALVLLRRFRFSPILTMLLCGAAALAVGVMAGI